MTVGELLDRADARELTEWQLLFEIKTEEDQRRRRVEDEVIEHRPYEPAPEDDEDA